MSDLSGISQEYALNADFAGRFNEIVMSLKRAFLMGKAIPSVEQLASAKKEMVQILETLVGVIEAHPGEGGNPNLRIPADLIERLRNHHGSVVGAYRQQWVKVADELDSGQTVTKESFDVLDHICELADSTTSAAFRRLRRF